MGQEQVSVRACAHPFRVATTDFVFPPGMTLREMAIATQPAALLRRNGHAYVGDRYVPFDQWDKVIPAEGAHVVIRLIPASSGGGKKSVLSAVISIAVLAAGAAFGAPLGAALFGDLGSIGSLNIATALGKGIISGVGFLLSSVLAPPAKPRMTSISPGRTVSPTLFIAGARNQLDPYGPVSVNYGKHINFPKLGGKTYTETIGDDQYVRQLFVWGRGRVNLYDLKIGNTLLSEFHDVEMEHYLDGELPDTVALYPNRVDEQGLNLAVTQAGGWQVQTAHAGADELIVDLTWPQGLFHVSAQDGLNKPNTIDFEIGISPTGLGTWTDHAFSITECHPAALRKAYRLNDYFDVDNGDYDVRVRRITADTVSTRQFDAFYWTALRSVIYGPPIVQEGVSFSAMRMKATGQLNGQVDQLNAVVASVIPDWDADTETWIERETQNPASHYRHALQLEDPVRGLADSRIDLETLQYWHERNAERGFKYNAVIDFKTTLADVLDEIAAAGRARRAAPDGIQSVIIDEEKSPTGNLFTPRNSWGYKGKINFPEIPHALRVPFINEKKGFVNDERIVYADGYSKYGASVVPGTVAATKFLTVEFPGITDPDLIYVHGREHIASMTLQPETHSWFTGADHIANLRGDVVQFAYDVILVGLGTARVKTVEDDGAGTPNATGVILDNDLTMEAGKTYGLRFRLSDNTQVQKNLVTVAGTGRHFTFETPFPLSDAPQTGDLLAFGEAGQESRAVLIKEITPGRDNTAQMIALDYAPARFVAPTAPIPAFDSGVTYPPSLTRPSAPVILSIQTDELVAVRNIDGSVQTRMVIRLQNNNAAAVVPVVRIRQSGTGQYAPAHVLSATAELIVLIGCDSNVSYDVEITYRKLDSESVLAANVHSLPATQTVLFVGESGRPDDVEDFDIQAVGATGIGACAANQNIDFSHFGVRFSPVTDGTATWNTMQPVSGLEDLLINYFQFPLQKGTYAIKAYDRSGNESLNAAFFIVGNDPLTTFANVATATEGPGFSGSKTNCSVSGGVLSLTDPSLMTGIYAFAGIINQSEKYTSRLTATINAFGDNPGNTMSSWEALSGVSSLSGSDPSQWGTLLQVSFTDDDPLGSPTWGTWQDFAIGDYSFVGARFQLLLNSVDGTTNPSVSQLSVKASMVQRVEGENGISALSTGYSVTYNPAFKSTPIVHVTIVNEQAGDHFVFTGPAGTGSPDRTGFKVKVKDNGGTDVARTINWSATGYGKEI